MKIPVYVQIQYRYKNGTATFNKEIDLPISPYLGLEIGLDGIDSGCVRIARIQVVEIRKVMETRIYLCERNSTSLRVIHYSDVRRLRRNGWIYGGWSWV